MKMFKIERDIFKGKESLIVSIKIDDDIEHGVETIYPINDNTVHEGIVYKIVNLLKMGYYFDLRNSL